MSEVKWTYETHDTKPADIPAGTTHTIVAPHDQDVLPHAVLTLEDLEAWLKGRRIENDYEEGFRDDLLAHVQAWKEGK